MRMSSKDRCGDGPRPDDMVDHDGGRINIDVGGRSENLMKRKTLRRCDDGQMSISESFTESEGTEAGKLLSLSYFNTKFNLENNLI